VGLIRLCVIPAGTLRIDKGAVSTPGIDDGVLIEVPVPIYLIRTDEDENVLVDTGMPPAHIDDPSTASALRTPTRCADGDHRRDSPRTSA
jgi:hypothetical protein